MLKGLQDEEKIEEMRKRLYDRGSEIEKVVRHELSDNKVDVTRDWAVKQPALTTTDLRAGMVNSDQAAEASPDKIIEEAPRRSYRSFVMIGSLLIFIIGAALSSLYIYFGGNSISGNNIQIEVKGQPLIGGGEVMDLEISVANQNSVPIAEATLIVKYPNGTRSTDDPPRNLYEERIPLNQIGVSEIQNIPLQVIVYGEENAIHEISATVEYRVNGSNGMFYKDSRPLAYRISSSPLTLRVDSIEKVASGQLIDVVLTVDSNASTPLKDILVTASYPEGFDFKTAEPEPVYGQNVWKISELLPEQSTEIKLQGVVSGLNEETLHINFEAGPASVNNQFIVEATLDEVSASFLIEKPFIDVNIAINSDNDREAVIKEGDTSTVSVSVKNTLDETVYDMTVEVIPSGNAIDENSIESESGFYDSNTNSIKWAVANNPNFDRILPGETRNLSFSVAPNAQRTTASYAVEVNVFARRVADSSALETLIGSNKAEAKFASHVSLSSQAGRNSSRFSDSGPIPPKVGEATTYTITLVAETGPNDVTGAVVETGLPLYVDWLNEFEADGTIVYNSVSKKIEWNIGNIPLGQRKEASFQVGLKPSISHVGSTPVLLNKQTLEAKDGFTNTDLQDSAPAVTTELSSEMGFVRENGKVTN